MEFKILYEELANSTEMIRALLSGVSQEEARVKPNAESWSIFEVTCHLYDEELEDFREHLDFILNRQNGEWHRINPEGWVTERKYNNQDFLAIEGKFFDERKKSLEWLKELENADWDIIYRRLDQYRQARCLLHGSRMIICTSINWWNCGGIELKTSRSHMRLLTLGNLSSTINKTPPVRAAGIPEDRCWSFPLKQSEFSCYQQEHCSYCADHDHEHQ